MPNEMWKKFHDLFKDFGKNFDDNFKNFGDYSDRINSLTSSFSATTPEEFMGGMDFIRTEEEGIDSKTGETYTKTTYMSKDGKRKYSRRVVNATPKTNKDWKTYNQSMEQSNRLYTLEMDLKLAIEKEQFEKAAEIRDEISKLKDQLKKEK